MTAIFKNNFFVSVESERGFTLIETLLTLTILGVLVVLLLSAMRLGLRSWEKGEASVEEISVRRHLFSKLTGEMASVYPYSLKSEGQKQYAFRGDSESIGFVTASPSIRPGRPDGGIKWVSYSLSEDGLFVREKVITSENLMEESGGYLSEIEPDVKKVSFEYKGDSGWEKTWDIESKKELPKAVKVLVNFKDGKTAFTMLTIAEAATEKQ